MRHEAIDGPMSCSYQEGDIIKALDTTGISVTGYTGASKNLTATAAAANPSIIGQLNSFDLFRDASAQANATINSLWQTGQTLANAQSALAGARTAGNPAPVISNLETIVATATAAFSAAVNIPASNTAGLTTSLRQVTEASSLMGMANYLVANPLPETPICLNPDGETFLQNIAGFEWWLTNSTGAVIADGIDNYRVTSDGFYVVSIAISLRWSQANGS
jgi:hypothetical protein